MPRERPPLPEGPAVVVGLKRSGLAVAKLLHAAGIEVRACDAGAADTAELTALGIDARAPDDGLALLPGARTLVKSPGVPQEATVVAAARERGIEVMGELEVGWRALPDHEFVAVTGSNGKTTVTEWIGHVHREAGLPVEVAGNVGTALSSLTPPAGATIVCECSSFQLEDTQAFAPEAAVLLNLQPDHLDRHGTFEAYTAAKLQIFANQRDDDIAVAPSGLDFAGRGRRVWWDEAEIGEVALPGAHNRLNAMATAAVCLARGVDHEAVRDGLRTFAGVRHRLELVATIDGVAYVNDSKATNVDAAVTGLTSFPGGVHAILGGRGVSGDLTPLIDAVRRHATAAYLIGEDGWMLAERLPDAMVAGDLERAVAAARAAARPGETVLLSPAAKSFDQYADFEARGDHFRALVSGGG